ncbi:MAG TPA: hypothetical protein VET65_09485 [Candidatus Limnocylindrales bacterium]|nr:hypothetical protein [Candidatus Limnocylindrales bacterium]
MKRAILVALTPLVLVLGACSLIPRPGVWHPIGAVPGTAGVWALVPLSGGRVLALGAPGGNAMFDPGRMQWSRVASMPPGLVEASATRLPDGRVFVVGAGEASFYLPAQDRWQATTPPPTIRQRQAAALLGDGRVLLVGGVIEGAATATTEIFDPARASWRRAAPLALPRIAPTATPLPDGRVLLTGGYGDESEIFATQFGFNQARPYPPELYDPVRDRWTTVPFAPQVANPATISLPDGTVMATAGFDGRIPSHVTQVFDWRTGLWTVKAQNPGGGGPAVILGDGRIALLGGSNAYDPGQDRWEALTPASIPVDQAIELPAGRALAVASQPFTGGTAATPSLIFDPAGYPALPGSSGPLASLPLFRTLAAISVALALLTGARLFWTRWRS